MESSAAEFVTIPAETLHGKIRNGTAESEPGAVVVGADRGTVADSKRNGLAEEIATALKGEPSLREKAKAAYLMHLP